MTVATTDQVKAAIKEASARAREQGNRLDADALQELQDIYRRASDDVRLRIDALAASDGSVRLANLQKLLQTIGVALRQLGQQEGQLLRRYQQLSSAAATESVADALTTDTLTSLSDAAVRSARAYQAADGLRLSDRLWRINNHAREVVGRAVESAVVQGASASQAALDFIDRGAPVPAQIQRKIAEASASSIGRATAGELMTGVGTPYQNARRLFRTEINRAHGIAYQSAVFALDDVVGTRFLLSPSHRTSDICDMHARVNLYGLGRGVYPPGQSPWPAHPNTLSYEEVVFDDEISASDRQGKESRIAWLRRQGPTLQYQVLGSRKKQQALTMGLLDENEIDQPWHMLKAKYEQEGITL